MLLEDFDRLGTEINFIPIGNNPENEVDGIAYTKDEITIIRGELEEFDKLKKSLQSKVEGDKNRMYS